jgi:peptidyl-prolyl cis-trans isomerase B (cyclophilin B)
MKKLTKIYGKIILVAIPLLIIAGYSYSKYNTDINTVEKINAETVQVLNKSANISELQNWDIIATMVTSKGKIKIKLYPDTAPKTVTNFLVHAQEGYYDNLIFHRVIDNFMIQWGDPLGTGVGGESIYGGSFEDEFFWNTENDAGTIAMANSGPATNGSQFFINERANNHLDNKHTVFWKVIEWMDVVDKITQVPMDIATAKPYTDIVIEKITVSKYNNSKFSEYKIADIELAKSEAQSNYNALIFKDKEQEEIQRESDTEAKEKKLKEDAGRVAKAWDEVSVKYRLTLNDGTFIDGNFDSDTLFTFVIDGGQTIKWFNEAIKGLKIWETQIVKIAPEDAYGPANIETKMEDFQQFKDAGITVAVGETIQIWRGGSIEIIDIQGDVVTITNPHQLGWKELNFEIELKYFVN